ncbi:MAG: DUF4406 domain-containing protein [Acidobacteria bacterium]|nr:DUF4406 domain-containing protein [Acidobacteriota bacterium]
MPETEQIIGSTRVVVGESLPFGAADLARLESRRGICEPMSEADVDAIVTNGMAYFERNPQAPRPAASATATAASPPAKLLAYVSGPYRDYRGEWFVRQNIREAEAVALELWRMGFAVICPHKNSEGFGGAAGDPEPWISGDLLVVERSDLIVMLPRWQESEGARIEMNHATESRIPVYYWPSQRLRLEAIARNDYKYLDRLRQNRVASLSILGTSEPADSRVHSE